MESGGRIFQAQRRTMVLVVLFMCAGGVLHATSQSLAHLALIDKTVQEILLDIALLMIFVPAVYVMRHSWRIPAARNLVLLGLGTKAAHLFIDTAEEFPALKDYWLFTATSWLHVILQETFSAAAVVFLVAGLVLFVGLHDEIERRLRQERARLREELDEKLKLTTVIEHAGDALLIADIKGIIEYTNPAFERATGYTREEIAGGNMESFLHCDERTDAGLSEMWLQLKSGLEWRGVCRTRKKDGTLRRVQVTISPVRDLNGEITRFVAVQRELSHETELQEKLVQAQKMEAVGRLAGGIAHNQRNMLSTILGWIEIARNQSGNRELVEAYLERSERVGRRAAKQIGDLLKFSRKTESHQEQVDLFEQVTQGVELARAAIPASIDIRVQSEVAAAAILADSIQFQEVVLNLIMNAAQAIGGNGVIEVQIEHLNGDDVKILGPNEGDRERWVAMRVTDNGSGIEAENHERIFEPFFTTKSPGEGTGLGMSVVHGIVASHGGHIRFESTVGLGTSFTVLFPLAGVALVS